MRWWYIYRYWLVYRVNVLCFFPPLFPRVVYVFSQNRVQFVSFRTCVLMLYATLFHVMLCIHCMWLQFVYGANSTFTWYVGIYHKWLVYSVNALCFFPSFCKSCLCIFPESCKIRQFLNTWFTIVWHSVSCDVMYLLYVTAICLGYTNWTLFNKNVMRY